MCGIVGIVDKRRQPRIDESLVRAMTDVIEHRGPDDEGQWISPDHECGLGFRRLSIIDLSSAGHQPMHTPDGRFTIVFNGEIYNHAELRPDLQSKGYVYSSRTDTETILYGYKEYGASFLHRMVGMWGIALWDNETRELFCARDRIGVKPLYYYHSDGLFIVASEIKSILKHPDVRARMNIDELPSYLALSASGPSETMFEGIHKIPAGHTLTLTANGRVRLERYWSPLQQNQAWSKLSVQDTQDHILALLRQAVKARMMSDVPFGVFLSGGIDSSVNVALMAELMNRPVDTFTVGFKELEAYNELQYARQVATHFGTNHHEILIDHTDALPALETMVWHEDEPNGDPVCIPLYFLSKLTRDSGTTVIQVGEGSDEQLCGYPWLLRDWRFYNGPWKWFRLLPQSIQKGITRVAGSVLSARHEYLALDYMRRAAMNNELYWGGGIDMTPTHQQFVVGKEYRSKISNVERLVGTIHEEARALNPQGDYIQEMAYFEFRHRLPELLLMRVDKLTMAHSLEARVPFLDHRLVEFTMSIPAATKIPDPYTTKSLLKKAVERILPHDIIYRKKQGFQAPVQEWFRGPWKDFATHVLMESPLVRENILDKKGIERAFAMQEGGKKGVGKSLYSLVNLCLWHKRFLE
jgi:asparagine synthase (glutamine-hydrolysing)